MGQLLPRAAPNVSLPILLSCVCVEEEKGEEKKSAEEEKKKEEEKGE